MNIGIDARLRKQTGVGRYTRNLFNQLKKINGKNTYLLLEPKIRWHSLAEQIFFPFWLLFKKIDLVHFPYFSFPLLCPKKFVITIHDLIPWHFKTGKASTQAWPIYEIKHFFYRQLLYWGARRAIHIIAVSQATKNQIIKTLKINPNKVTVIYEGVEDKFKIKNLKLKIKNYFLYVGNAYPHKNLEKLVEAIKSIDNLKLILVGPDDFFYRRLKQAVKERKMDNKIIFYGPATDEELTGLYKNAAAFINPSLAEGFGLSGLEAMACGCPVLCSGIEVFREIYGQAAIYFNPTNTKDMQRKIHEILAIDRKEKFKIVNKAKERADLYSWEKCAKETIKVYESCFCL